MKAVRGLTNLLSDQLDSHLLRLRFYKGEFSAA